jgi:hypothetical protein
LSLRRRVETTQAAVWRSVGASQGGVARFILLSEGELKGSGARGPVKKE